MEHRCIECESTEKTYTEQKTGEVLCEKCLIKRITKEGDKI